MFPPTDPSEFQPWNPDTAEEYRTRDRLLTGGPIDWENDARGRVKHFNAVPVGHIEYLRLRGWVNPADRQNDGPTVGTVISWGLARERYDGVRVWCDGYVVAPSRADERVSIDGIRVESDVPADEWRALLIDHPPDTEEVGITDPRHDLPPHRWAWWD
jgi:hypothetical protein